MQKYLTDVASFQQSERKFQLKNPALAFQETRFKSMICCKKWGGKNCSEAGCGFTRMLSCIDGKDGELNTYLLFFNFKLYGKIARFIDK